MTIALQMVRWCNCMYVIIMCWKGKRNSAPLVTEPPGNRSDRINSLRMEKVKHHLGSCVSLILKELCSPGGWFPVLNENPPDRNVDWNTPGSRCQTLTFCHYRQQKSIFFCLESVSSHKTKQSKSNYHL